jgi:hypothetical protein
MARPRRRPVAVPEYHLCQACNLPIVDLHVGVRHGWVHRWCAPDAPPVSFEALLKRERVSIVLRHLLLRLVPAALQPQIVEAYNEARAKRRRG